MQLTQLPLLTPDADEVVIHVRACGVNFPDLLQVQGRYQFKPPLPFAPGGEVAGVVSAVGADVKAHAIGDKVTAMTGWGGFATELKAREDQILKMPRGKKGLRR